MANNNPSGRISDGTGNEDLRPRACEGSVINVTVASSAIIPLTLETDNTYGDNAYDKILSIEDGKFPHISICDKNISQSMRFVAINLLVDNESIFLWYIDDSESKDILYKVELKDDGTYIREEVDEGEFINQQEAEAIALLCFDGEQPSL